MPVQSNSQSALNSVGLWRATTYNGAAQTIFTSGLNKAKNLTEINTGSHTSREKFKTYLAEDNNHSAWRMEIGI